MLALELVVVTETATETAEFGTPQPPALPPCPSNPNVPLTKNVRPVFAASFPPAAARVSTIRQGSSGTKLFSGVDWVITAAVTGWASEPALPVPPGAAPADAKPATPAAAAIIRPRPTLTGVFMYCSFRTRRRPLTGPVSGRRAVGSVSRCAGPWIRGRHTRGPGDGAGPRRREAALSLPGGRGQHTTLMVNGESAWTSGPGPMVTLA